MSASPATRRAIAEIDFGDGANVSFKVGNRSIHQFWHLFSPHFRHVLLAPQRRADSGKVAWTWREPGEKRPVTATELVEVRRRLSEANRSLAGGFGGMGRRDEDEESSLEGQVRASVGEMVDQLLAQRDSTLVGFVCRTDAGLMLHSWGAAVAAQPYFPDAQHGEISGTVFVGVERAAGVSVVLENTQGIGGARVKSDREGGFHFPSVAPGRYHLRVADRSDFPGGLTVEMERESIAGLELRSTSDEPLSMAADFTPPTENVPWFRRRSAGLVLLVLIVGAGIFAWWWSERSSDPQAIDQNRPSSWQAAKGQLAANNPQTPANDDHKVGQEGGFSTLANSIPPPKILHPQHDRAPSKWDGVTRDKASPSPEDSAVPDQRGSGETPASADSSGKLIPRPEALARAPRDSLNSSARDAGEKVSSPNDGSGAASDGDDVKSPKEITARSARAAANNKKAGTPRSASMANENVSPDEAAASGESNASTDSATSTAPNLNGEKSSKRSGLKGSAAAEAGRKNTAAGGSDADAGAPNSATPTPGETARGQLKPSGDKKAKETGGKPTANGATVAADESSGAVSTGETPDDSASPAAAANLSAGKNQASKKTNPTSRTPSQPEADASRDQENSTTSAPSSTPTSFNKKSGPVSVAAEKKSTSATPTNDFPASPAEAEADQSTAVESSDSAVTPLSATRRKPEKKMPSSASLRQKELDQPIEPESATGLSVISPSISAVTAKRENDEPLVRMGTIHVSGWKQRIVRDLIIPTRPVTEAEEEAMGILREKLRQEEAARMPQAFQHPQMSGGIVVEFAGVSPVQSSFRWRDDAGMEPSGASVSNQRAELTWSGGVPPPNTHFTLCDSSNRVIAAATIDGNGALTLKTISNARVWYWCGIERAPARSDNIGAVNSGEPFEWRLLSGPAIPSSWTRDDRWLNGRGQRIDIPLDTTTKTVGNYRIALVDPVTGWAVVSDFAAQAP